MWMMNERGDLAFPVKELARSVQAPTVGDMMCLRRAVKYLISTQSYVQTLTWDAQQPENVLRVHVDASWASSPDRRSTSGGVMRLEGFELGHWARTQPVIAQSSCEAELLALKHWSVRGMSCAEHQDGAWYARAA